MRERTNKGGFQLWFQLVSNTVPDIAFVACKEYAA